jgi:uncharacterized protein (DUF2267 family)
MRHDEFIARVQEQAHLTSRHEAIQTTKATLATLGERLYRTERENLAAQLPDELKQTLFEGQEPESTRQQISNYSLEEFYNRVGARADLSYSDAVSRAKAVMTVLQEAVSAGIIEEILSQLPPKYGRLFAEEEGGT